MPQIKDYPNTKLANSVDEFVKELDQVVKNNTNQIEVNQWLEENTWQDRVNQYLELMDIDLSEKPFRGGI